MTVSPMNRSPPRQRRPHRLGDSERAGVAAAGAVLPDAAVERRTSSCWTRATAADTASPPGGIRHAAPGTTPKPSGM